jgi:hypothetical protein
MTMGENRMSLVTLNTYPYEHQRDSDDSEDDSLIRLYSHAPAIDIFLLCLYTNMTLFDHLLLANPPRSEVYE